MGFITTDQYWTDSRWAKNPADSYRKFTDYMIKYNDDIGRDDIIKSIASAPSYSYRLLYYNKDYLTHEEKNILFNSAAKSPECALSLYLDTICETSEQEDILFKSIISSAEKTYKFFINVKIHTEEKFNRCLRVIMGSPVHSYALFHIVTNNTDFAMLKNKNYFTDLEKTKKKLLKCACKNQYNARDILNGDYSFEIKEYAFNVLLNGKNYDMLAGAYNLTECQKVDFINKIVEKFDYALANSILRYSKFKDLLDDTLIEKLKAVLLLYKLSKT